MSNPKNDPKFMSIKVMINKEKTKVLFAEAKNDFVDVLLSFLTLPLGKVVTILQKHCGEETPAIGSLNTLYTGLLNLDETYFCVGGAKQMLLNPRSSSRGECRKLALDITDSPSSKYFLCEDQKCPKFAYKNISMYSDIGTCGCGKSLNREIRVGKRLGGGSLTIKPLSFIITDDLRVAPIVTGIFQTLNNLGVTDTQGAEMETFSFGIDEIRDLLELSLTSATPLTDIIIEETGANTTAAKAKPGILLHHIQKDDAESGKMVLKVCLQKSTNKFLFAEAIDEFVELLFSFLTIPLGGVEFLLGGNTGLNNIDNLYRSVSNDIDDKYFRAPDTKSRLINPKLPHGYNSGNQFLPLSQEAPPKLYYQGKWNGVRYEYSFHEKGGSLVSLLRSIKENYIKKETICFVTDDLSVTPSLATSISILNGRGIPLSDVKEMEVRIGVEEALSILKASLTSKTAITDGLIKPMLNKQPKLERKRKNEDRKTKVLFAEANTDFVDVLLSFLTLPLGKVVTILRINSGEEAAAIGSLKTLYTGLCDLNDNYFCVRGAKQMLVNPRSSFGAECRKLALNITDCQPNQYFLCPNYTSHNSVCMYSDIATCEQCGSSLNREIRVAECLDGGAFTIEPFSFIITDDLSVPPIVSGIIQTLSNLGITDTRGAEMKSFSFGVNEIRDLLKFSLTSATPLTDIIINKTHTSSSVANPELGILFHHNQKVDDKSRKMVLKVCLQKSTNKFLFAEATGEFVELLFSFLTVPLGGVEFLLGGKTGLKNIDNLYRSVSDGFDDKCFITPESKNRLINPKLPNGYISKSQFLPLCEEARPKLYYEWKWNEQSKRNEYFYYEKGGTLVSSFKLSKENYVKKQTMCFVTDDLTVSPSLTSSISILNGLSDVRETELHIGLGEALSILKASLTSKTAITDGLIKPMLDKLPKLERQPKQES